MVSVKEGDIALEYTAVPAWPSDAVTNAIHHGLTAISPS